MQIYFRWTRETEPGDRWLDLLDRTWPSYRQWFLQDGDGARPDYRTSLLALRRYMPELIPLWYELIEVGAEVAAAAGQGDQDDHDAVLGRMLALYRPTAYLSGCSQAVFDRGSPRLVRNYDYAPSLCEATFTHTTWLGKRVVAASDCLWGVLDGINEDGLTVALAFGGRPEVGDGFGIPLILRYVLQTCATTREAIAVLMRVPSHMAYNVSLLDAWGDRCVVFVGPDREASVHDTGVATNHQQRLEWPAYDRIARSAERADFLHASLADPTLDAETLTNLFLQPPLFKTDYDKGSGTLYTASYDPVARSAAWMWPQARIDQSVDGFVEQELLVPLADEPQQPA